MFGSVPAELVWYVSSESEAYDVLLYRAMSQEFQLSEAFAGRTPHGLWASLRHIEHRWAPLERACLALLGTGAP